MICPMPPLMFLTFLVALATGFMSLAWMSRRSYHHYSPVTESLVAPLLFYNLWVLIWFVRQYTETTLLGGLPPHTWRLLNAALTWTSMGVAILWGSSYLSFTLQATRPAHTQISVRQAQQGAFFLGGVTALTCLVLILLRLDPLIRLFSRGLSSLVFLSVAMLSLWIFFSAHRREEEESWRKLRVLGATYSALFVTLTVFVWWNRFSSLIPRYTFVTLQVGFEIIYNLLTIFWIHFFDRTPLSHKVSTQDPVAGPTLEPAFNHGFGITKREQEVIQLICRGLTNQEIADALFISLKTVKDHNYHIFQKTGVRNRVELVQLALGPAKSEQPG